MRQLYGVTQIGLFGSHARRTSRDDSDIDILVDLDTEKKHSGTFSDSKDISKKTWGSLSILALKAR